MFSNIKQFFVKKASKKTSPSPPSMSRRASDTKTVTCSPASSTSTLVDPPPISLESLTFLQRTEKTFDSDRYEVLHDTSGKYYDLKVTRTGMMGPEEKAQALQETDAFAAVKGNSSIVDMAAHWDDGSNSYQVTEYLPYTLKDARRQQALDAGRTRLYAAHMVHAVESLHKKGITHNDVRTSNVFFASTGRPVLGGMSKAKLPKPILTCDDDFLDFNASEHAEGGFFNFDLKFNDADFAADIWGLGTCLYEMATGRSFCRNRTGGIKYQRNDYIPKPLRGLINLIMDSDISEYKTNIATIKAHPYFTTIDWQIIARPEAGAYNGAPVAIIKPHDLGDIYSDNVAELVCDWDITYLEKKSPPSPPPPPTPVIDITQLTLKEVVHGYTPCGRYAPRYFSSIDEEEFMIGSSLDMD